MRLYGKDSLKRRLDDIAAKGRLPHAIMFSGNEGCGRKILARYTAQLFLCPNHACGECAECRNIENDNHPDVIFVKRGCAKEKYNMENFREILRGTVIKPNNGDIKVYVFEDCDTMLPQLHNTLLKLIEEPPSHLRFVFTCANTSVIPETVMSRVTEFEVPDTDTASCVQCLVDGGMDRKRAEELALTFSGNIGKCRAAPDGDSPEMKLIEAARNAAAAIGRRDGFGLAAVLSGFARSSDRDNFNCVIDHLTNILRDALAVKYGESSEFFSKKEAQDIASNFSEAEIVNMLDAAVELEKNEIYDLNPALSGVYFTSRIF